MTLRTFNNPLDLEPIIKNSAEITHFSTEPIGWNPISETYSEMRLPNILHAHIFKLKNLNI